MKSSITYDDVAKAANQIVSRQESPNIRMVRLLIGSGSFSTIAKHLTTWREQSQGSLPSPPPEWEVSPELRALLAQEITRHVRQKEVAQEAMIQKFAGEREDTLAENERLERQIEALTSRLEEMRTKEIQSEERIRLLGSQIEEERKRAGEMTMRFHEAEKTIVRLEVWIETAEKEWGKKHATEKKSSPSRKRSGPSRKSPALTKPAKFMTLEDEAPQPLEPEQRHEFKEKEAKLQ